MTVCAVSRLVWLLAGSYTRSRLWALGFLVCVALTAGRPAHAADASSPAWRAAHQLLGAQMPSGQFAFEHDFIPGRRRLDTNSNLGRLAYVTRQAAAAYGLSNYFLHDQNVDVARTLVAVLRNLQKLSLPIDKASGQAALESIGILELPFGRYKLHNTMQWLGLLYRPNGDGRLVSYDRSYETAWGGATALSLLTELQFYQASHDPQFAQLRLAWLKGLLVLYDGGRGFRELPGSIDENTMSNAQVWLALAVYTRLFADDRAHRSHCSTARRLHDADLHCTSQCKLLRLGYERCGAEAASNIG